MKQSAIDALIQALYRLQEIGSDLYDASDAASEAGDLLEASKIKMWLINCMKMQKT
jgi:hypothetical protein